MLDCNVFPGLDRDYLGTEVNLFLLPILENDGDEALTRAGQKIFSFPVDIYLFFELSCTKITMHML